MNRLTVLSMAVLLALLVAAVLPFAALAQDGGEQPPAGEAVSPVDEPVVDEAPTEDVTPSQESVAEVFEAAAEADVILANAEGEILSAVAIETVDLLTSENSDPWFIYGSLRVGYSNTASCAVGVAECHPLVSNSIQAAINDSRSSGTIITIEAGDYSGETFTFNDSSRSFSLASNVLVNTINLNVDYGTISVSGGSFSAGNVFVDYGGPKTATIQQGINLAATNGTVNVANGLYIASNTTIDKPLTLQGESQAGVVIAPAALDGNKDNAFANSAQNGIVIKANNVTIKNLTINGNGNSALTTHANNFRTGIVTLDASQTGGGTWNNLLVDNVFVKYVYRRGISVFPTNVTGTVIQNSTVEYVAFNHGMYLAGQSQVINNTVKHAFQGIVLALDPTTPAGTSVITGNTLTEIGNFPGVWGDQGSGVYWGQPRAIQFNNSDSAGRTVEIKNNTINDIASNGPNGTVGIYTRLANSASIVDNNTITLTSGDSWAGAGSQSVGMLLGWSYANGFTASNNTVNSSGYGMGIMVFGAGTAAKPMVLEGNTITGTNSAHITQGDGTGIYIANQYLFAGDKNESYVIIRNGNTISGFVRGIDVEKVSTSTQPLTVIVNGNSIAGNTIGIDASTLSTAIDATGNWWGDASGPYDASVVPDGCGLTLDNSGGAGNAVSKCVRYDSWLTENPFATPPAGGGEEGNGNKKDLVTYLPQATAIITSLTDAELPSALPEGKTFVASMSVTLMQGGAEIEETPSGVQVSFDIPAGMEPPFTVLLWNGTEWVEVPSAVVDGKVVFTITGSGTYVLVSP